MKTIYSKIEFHYTYLILAIGFVLTGHFINLIIFTSLIIIHELGHTITALLLKYRIDKIIIYPYGGLTKLNTLVNTNITKDLIIAISGLGIQTLYFCFIYYLYSRGIVREYVYNLFSIYHNSMLIFNLLPIIPLDGSKVVNLLLSKYLNYNLSNKITIIISLFTIIFILKFEIFQINYSTIIIITILMKNIYTFYHELDYIYNKFLLERYLYKFNYPKIKIIHNKDQMYKNKSHLFLKNNKIITEREFLGHFFIKRQ